VIQPSFVIALQLILEFILMVELPAEYPADILDGLAVKYAGAPPCVTVTVAEVPPPLMVT
jgi:hypothetical protein